MSPDEVTTTRTHYIPSTGILRGGGRRFVVAAVGLVAATAALGVAGYGLVPERMAVRFTLGSDFAVVANQYLPRAVGLTVAPAVGVCTLAGDRLLRRHVPDVGEADPYYSAMILAILACLLAVQALLVVVNAPTL